jgi:signal peptidase II
MRTTTMETKPESNGGRPWLHIFRGIKGRFLLLSLAVLVLDQWSKWLVELHLLEYHDYSLIPGFLQLTHVRNTGVAFGLFAAHDNTFRVMVLTALGLLALGFVLYYYAVVPARERRLLLGLALVIGGAVGNLVDRVLNGGVTDFIDFYYGDYHWHTFNVADSAITVGIGLLILGSFFGASEEESADPVPESTP